MNDVSLDAADCGLRDSLIASSGHPEEGDHDPRATVQACLQLHRQRRSFSSQSLVSCGHPWRNAAWRQHPQHVPFQLCSVCRTFLNYRKPTHEIHLNRHSFLNSSSKSPPRPPEIKTVPAPGVCPTLVSAGLRAWGWGASGPQVLGLLG